MPTICEAIGVDGARRSATGCRSPRSSRGEEPPWWRDAGALGVRLARVRCIATDVERVAVGPPARSASTSRSVAHRRARLRAVRRRLVAVLRPRRRPDVAHRDHRPGASCSRSPRQMLTWRVQPRRPRRSTDMLSRTAASAAGRRCHPTGRHSSRLSERARSHRPRADRGRPARRMEPGRQAQRRPVHRAVGAVPDRRRSSSAVLLVVTGGVPAGAWVFAGAVGMCAHRLPDRPRMGVRARRLLARLPDRGWRWRAARGDRRHRAARRRPEVAVDRGDRRHRLRDGAARGRRDARTRCGRR